MDYDLSRLGSRDFEHLSQALTLAVLGPHVRVFGDGPDGGREATFDGVVAYPRPGGSWNGYGVVQAKYRQRLLGTGSDTQWLHTQLRSELDRWVTDRAEARTRRKRSPEYLLITTNVPLSAVPGSGGIDTTLALIASYADRLGLKGWDVWAYDKINRFLDGHQDIRRAYGPFVAVGDVFGRLDELIASTAVDVGALLVRHAAKELVARQAVRLGQAGHTDPSYRLPLAKVAIDVPGQRMDDPDSDPLEVVRYILEGGDRIRRPSHAHEPIRHIALIGAPGQGKTTLGQLVCQAYRTAILASRPRTALSAEAGDLVDQLGNELKGLGIAEPAVLRWPVQVSLAEYGDRVAGGAEVSLLRHLADAISARDGAEEVTAAQLKAWLKEWPWLLALDGLDEVASPHAREHVLRFISEFLVDAADMDADVLVVATTRPQGYAQELDTGDYEHIDLLPLSSRQAVQYARRLADARHATDPDAKTQLLERVNLAVQEDLTARLMQTPLQVTIMSLLLERYVRAPQSRHGLFDAYYQTIYDREMGRAGFLGGLLEQHRTDIDHLHERIGLLLQHRAEEEGDADAAIPARELHRLVVARLAQQGQPEDRIEGLAGHIVRAATDRLVLVVPKGVDQVGFEVRSLQEFMAARALTAGPEAQILPRLNAVATSAHWRNTWLLAAGRIFARAEHLRAQLLTDLKTLDVEGLLAMLVRPGARLAVDLLDDDVAAQAPYFQRLLVQHATDLLDQPPGADLLRMADVLRRSISTDQQSRDAAEYAVRRALNAGAVPALSGIKTLEIWLGPGAVGTSAHQELTRRLSGLSTAELPAVTALASRFGSVSSPIRARAGTALATGHKRLAAIVRTIQGEGFDETDRHGVAALRRELEHIRLPTASVDHAEVTLTPAKFAASFRELDQALGRPNVADAVAVAIDNIPINFWTAKAHMRELCLYWMQRRPVGPALAVLVPELQDQHHEEREVRSFSPYDGLRTPTSPVLSLPRGDRGYG